MAYAGFVCHWLAASDAFRLAPGSGADDLVRVFAVNLYLFNARRALFIAFAFRAPDIWLL